MNYAEWMERTSRGKLKPRSSKLRKVDSELRMVANIRDISQLSTLRKALNDWKADQGPFWRQSIRNHDGAVEELDALINGNATIFNQAALAARISQARQNNAGLAVKQKVYQKFGANDPDFAGAAFSWDVVLQLVKRGICIEAKVRVCGSLYDETAGRLEKFRKKRVRKMLDTEKLAFRTHILSAWNCATVVVNEPGRTRYYDLVFDIEWVDSDSPQPKYEININKLHATTPNRDNLLNWLFGNREACIHEFGHMIGCPDEYNTVEVRGFGHVIHDATMYNQAGFTTDSIMNNPGPAGRIHNRHFSFVARHCRQMLKADTDIRILRRVGPTAVEEVRQLMVAGAHARRRQALGFVD